MKLVGGAVVKLIVLWQLPGLLLIVLLRSVRELFRAGYWGRLSGIWSKLVVGRSMW